MKLLLLGFINAPHDNPVRFDGAQHNALPGRRSDPRPVGSGTAPQYTASRSGTCGIIALPGGRTHCHVLHAFNGAVCCGPSTV